MPQLVRTLPDQMLAFRKQMVVVAAQMAKAVQLDQMEMKTDQKPVWRTDSLLEQAFETR